MFFAKGEIIMNSIYKVIWSKAKNCYVVASEIAKSHTKSASGQSVRRSALASLLALSLLCGGLGVATAADGTVHVEDIAATATSKEVYTTDKVYTKTETDGKLALKADATDVATNTANISNLDGKLANLTTTVNDKADKTYVDTELTKKADATALGEYAKTADVNTELEKKADKATTLAGYGITDAYTKSQVSAKLNDKADKTDLNQAQTAIDDLNKKTTKITYDASNGTSVDGVTFNAGAVTGVTSINGTEIGTKESGAYIHQDNSIWGNMKKVDTQVKTNADAIAQEKTDREKAIGNLTEDKNYIKKDKNVSDNLVELDKQAKTNADAIAQEKTDRENAIGSLTEDKNYIKKDKNVSDNLVELDKQAKANADAITETNQRTHGITRNDIRNETSIEGKVTVDTDGNIKAEGTITSNGLNAGDGDIKTNGTVSAGNVSTGTLETTGDATIGRDLTVKGTLNTKDVTAETIHISKSEDTVDYKSEGSIIGEGGNLSVSNKKTDKITNITEESQLHVNEKGTVNWATSKDNVTGNVTEGRSEVKADHIKNSVKKTEGGTTFGYEENITETGKVGTATDKDGNRNELTQTATGTENTVTSKDGNKSTTKQEAGSISSTVYDKDGNVKASSEMKEDGSISNNATGDMTNTVGGNQTNKIDGNQENTIGGDQTTTVEGKVTETYKKGQATNVTGNQEIHVTENQTNKIDGDQVNTIGGSQTTTVEGKVTENYKAGQATNVTGNQDVTVSGTQTTTATDIKRNASSGMIDTIDNDYGTNTETKVAGKTTTDVSIKGTGEKGQYIRGANESRDYLIKGTLKNSETKTVEKTSTEITDGTNKASTIQDAKNLAGSVTNGTGTGVSGIHANDDGSVSIDSGVTDGTNTSVQKQTASAIATDVKDGAGNENASVANATTSANTITNGTKANTVISTADGTRFINSEAAAPVTGASGAGTAVDTTIKGNTITTGKVTMDYAEVMKDLGVHGSATVDNDLTVKGITNTKTLNVTEDAKVGRDLAVGGNATIAGDVTARSYKVDGKTYIDANGIHANNQKITDVADGSISEGSKDAVNGGQLYGVKRDLEHQVDKVGANAAAMANLRPMEFDPSSKWNIAAAIGNYGSETAAALGAFYRPNDNVMVNLSTAFGTGENMVGGGVSVRLGKGGNKLSREENNALKDQVNDLTARMDALLSVLNPNMSKDFPDVPENHWAYEAVSRLAGNDIVQGYPDGEFHGERTMTRYEMAEIIYNALSRGAEAERELVEEFKPELQAMAASEKATAEKAEG